jgi:hypothetical protein
VGGLKAGEKVGASRHADMQIDRYTDRKADSQVDRKTGRQAERRVSGEESTSIISPRLAL